MLNKDLLFNSFKKDIKTKDNEIKPDVLENVIRLRNDFLDNHQIVSKYTTIYLKDTNTSRKKNITKIYNKIKTVISNISDLYSDLFSKYDIRIICLSSDKQTSHYEKSKDIHLSLLEEIAKFQSLKKSNFNILLETSVEISCLYRLGFIKRYCDNTANIERRTQIEDTIKLALKNSNLLYLNNEDLKFSRSKVAILDNDVYTEYLDILNTEIAYAWEYTMQSLKDFNKKSSKISKKIMRM